MGRGAQTRDQILDRALKLASRDGLGGLSIGGLAAELGMSKSGLFGHFGSKEELQVQVLRAAADRFASYVVHPAFAAPRGEPRVRALFERWLAWEDHEMPGGCVMIAASTELDDQPGPPRDYLVSVQQLWTDTIARSARLAADEGHFRVDLDCEQFAFELRGIMNAYHHAKRLLGDARAEPRARAAFERLVAWAAAGD